MSDAPERIWITHGTDEFPWYITAEECVDGLDTEYVRADIVETLKDQLKETQLRELAALGQAQEHYEALQTARNDALGEAEQTLPRTAKTAIRNILALQTKGG